MKRFCYRCGALERDAGPLIDGLCQRCFSKETRLLQVPEKVRLILCKDCRAHFSQGRWNPIPANSSLDNIVRELVLQSVKITHLSSTGKELIPATQAFDIEFHIRPDLEKGTVLVGGKGKVHELQAEPKYEEASIKLETVYRTCQICSLKRSGYHEAIVQIRGTIDKHELSKLGKKLESLATKTEFVTDVKMVKGGMDLYVGSLTLGRRMAQVLRKSGAAVGESSKLVGQSKNGRRKYRVTILARFP